MRDPDERHDGEEPEFDPAFDSWHWKRLNEADYELQIVRHETGFPCFPNQFLEIIEYMTPHEVWVRVGEEIRFVWQNGNVRKTLEFVRIDNVTLPQGIKFQMSFEIGGEEHWSFWGSCSDFWVLPNRGFLPPRIIFCRNLEYMPLTSTVLLAVMRRGCDGGASIEPRAHTIWVG